MKNEIIEIISMVMIIHGMIFMALSPIIRLTGSLDFIYWLVGGGIMVLIGTIIYERVRQKKEIN